MTAKNDITGDALRTKVSNKKYDEGWDLIFSKKKNNQTPVHFAETRYPHLKEKNKNST